MSVERRLLDVLEAATVTREPPEAWAARVTVSLTSAICGGVGAAALAFDAQTRGVDVLASSARGVAEVIDSGQSSLDEPHHDAVYGGETSAQTAYELFGGRIPGALESALSEAEASDVLGVASRTGTSGGVSFAVLLSTPRTLDRQQRGRLRGLGAQLAIAYRVRGALERLAHEDDEPDALREGLGEAMRELDRCRAGGRTKTHATDPVALWERLLAEGWVLVPVEMSGGRTRIVAVRTPDGQAMSLRRLPPREREVVRLAALGHSNKEIGWRLRLAEGTVAERLRRAQQRLGVSRRATLARWFGGLA